MVEEMGIYGGLIESETRRNWGEQRRNCCRRRRRRLSGSCIRRRRRRRCRRLAAFAMTLFFLSFALLEFFFMIQRVGMNFIFNT